MTTIITKGIVIYFHFEYDSYVILIFSDKLIN